jgi:hypothetical protein
MAGSRAVNVSDNVLVWIRWRTAALGCTWAARSPTSVVAAEACEEFNDGHAAGTRGLVFASAKLDATGCRAH